jgi:hypothetical protein
VGFLRSSFLPGGRLRSRSARLRAAERWVREAWARRFPSGGCPSRDRGAAEDLVREWLGGSDRSRPTLLWAADPVEARIARLALRVQGRCWPADALPAAFDHGFRAAVDQLGVRVPRALRRHGDAEWAELRHRLADLRSAAAGVDEALRTQLVAVLASPHRVACLLERLQVRAGRELQLPPLPYLLTRRLSVRDTRDFLCREMLRALWSEWIGRPSVPSCLDPRLGRVLELVDGLTVFSDLTLLVARPALVRFDSSLSLHADHGPALGYPGGIRVFAWHGVVLPRELAEEPAELSPWRISAVADPAVRLALKQRVGVGRYLRRVEIRALDAEVRAAIGCDSDTAPVFCGLVEDADGDRWFVARDGTTIDEHFMPVPPSTGSCSEADDFLSGVPGLHIVAQA